MDKEFLQSIENEENKIKVIRVYDIIKRNFKRYKITYIKVNTFGVRYAEEIIAFRLDSKVNGSKVLLSIMFDHIIFPGNTSYMVQHVNCPKCSVRVYNSLEITLDKCSKYLLEMKND